MPISPQHEAGPANLPGSEQAFRASLEHAPIGVFQADAQGGYCAVNERWCHIMGLSPAEAAGDGWLAAVHPEDREAVQQLWHDTIVSGKAFALEHRCRTPEGKIIWLFTSASALRDGCGATIGYLGTVVDITERRDVEEKLRQLRTVLERQVEHRTRDLVRTNRELVQQVEERTKAQEDLKRQLLRKSELLATQAALLVSEEQFRLLVQSVTDHAIFMLDPNGYVATWNAGAARISGYTAEEIIGRHFSLFYTAEDVSAGKPACALRDAERGGHMEEEGWRLRKDGSQFWASVGLTALRSSDGTLRGFAKVSRDMTARKNAEITLQRSGEQLRALTSRLQAVQEEERTRIARELHDHIGQSMTSLLIGLRTLELASSLEEAVAESARLRRIAAETVNDVRRLAHAIRHSVLEDLGLETALRYQAEQFTETYGVQVDIYANGLDQRLPAAAEAALYRIAQEALTNVAKHAAAKMVSILLHRSGPDVHMIVEDDGCGFEMETVAPSVASMDRLGLYGMRERVAKLHGSLQIESAPGRGTTCSCTFKSKRTRHEDSGRDRR